MAVVSGNCVTSILTRLSGLRLPLLGFAQALVLSLLGLFSTPAFAQSAGCNTVNAGYFNWSGTIDGYRALNAQFIAGERLIAAFSGQSAAGSNPFLDMTARETTYLNVKTPMARNTSVSVTASLNLVETGLTYVLMATSAESSPYESTGDLTMICEAARPELTSLSANRGYTSGGNTVTITGSGFYPTTSVQIDGQITASTYHSSTRIDVTMPSRSAGTATITLMSGASQSATSLTYIYFRAGALEVLGPNLKSTGPIGGPFAPEEGGWLLTNVGDEDITVRLNGPNGAMSLWQFVESAGGLTISLAARDSQYVEVYIIADAGTTDAGVYSNDFTFTNVTSGLGTASRSAQLTIEPRNTSLTLASSNTTPVFGDEIVLTAELTEALSATGSIEFFAGTTVLGTAPIIGGQSKLTLSTLLPGDHYVGARYVGDQNNNAASSPLLLHSVGALSTALSLTTTASPVMIGDTVTFTASLQPSGATGEVIFSVDGSDHSPIAVSNGVARFSLGVLEIGMHQIVARYSGDATHGGSISDVLRQEVVSGLEDAQAEIDEFLQARGAILLANQPSSQRRISRLNGQVPSMPNLGSAITGYLPILVDGGILSGSASLAQIDQLVGNGQPSRFDAWVEGTIGRYGYDGATGTYGIISLGADYLVTDDLLIGGFAQIDKLQQGNKTTSATASGLGWMVGPSITARLGDHLYLDILAAAGRGGNTIIASNNDDHNFGSTRLMTSLRLEGEWKHGNWTFAPVSSLSWLTETSDAYTSSRGVEISSVTVDQGQFTLGPGLRHHLDLGNDMTLSSNARFELVAGYTGSTVSSDQSSLAGRASGGFAFGFTGEGTFGLTLSHDGLFAPDRSSTSISLRLSSNLN